VGLHRRMRRRPPAVRVRLGLKVAFAVMGIAFLLLETKSVIQFSLLFGTTWLNNSLVFLAALVLVLLANWTARLAPSRTLYVAYAALFVSCSLTFLIPLATLLEVASGLQRFVVASLLTFAPIFFANLIFSVTFRDQPVAEHLFGWNLLGATLGGVLEYTSLAFGYQALGIVVLGCYTVVLACLLGSGLAGPEVARRALSAVRSRSIRSRSG